MRGWLLAVLLWCLGPACAGGDGSTTSSAVAGTDSTSTDSGSVAAATVGSSTVTSGASTGQGSTTSAADLSSSGSESGSSTGVPRGCGSTPGMVCVDSGNFARGTNDMGLPADEQPQRLIFVSDFEIDENEVNVAEYTACVDDGACSDPADDFGDGSGCNFDKVGLGDHPINCVDWFQADAYCTYVGKQLPTEAEWEKAARGIDGRTYPWGEVEADCTYAVMNDGENSCGTGTPTMPVGSKSPDGDSPYGVKDMAGNVWEWVGDWYSDDYYSIAPDADPLGPGNGTAKIVRGGGWPNSIATPSNGLRASDRAESMPAGGAQAYGIRCVRRDF